VDPQSSSTHNLTRLEAWEQARIGSNPYNFASTPSSPGQETQKKKNFSPEVVCPKDLGRFGHHFVGLVLGHVCLSICVKGTKVMVWQP